MVVLVVLQSLETKGLHMTLIIILRAHLTKKKEVRRVSESVRETEGQGIATTCLLFVWKEGCNLTTGTDGL